jgi:hypothetical protein
MSIIHYIINKKPLNILKLNKFVSTIEGARCKDNGDGVFYFWIEGKSTRGFDLTLEQGHIEIRNTVLSNRHDYELTNKIIDEILYLTDGIIIDEDEEQVSNLPVFDNPKIAKFELSDCEIIHALSSENDDIAIYGPNRKVHFGKRLHHQFNKFKGEDLKNKMFDVILTVNYLIPNFEYGNIIQVGDSEEDNKIIKLLTNETNYIIDKYDYIMFNTSEEKPIIITNEILNTILPSNWELVDEFTIVAPITNSIEWNKLLTNAEKFNSWNNF